VNAPDYLDAYIERIQFLKLRVMQQDEVKNVDRLHATSMMSMKSTIVKKQEYLPISAPEFIAKMYRFAMVFN
jgi:hypothetical protein